MNDSSTKKWHVGTILASWAPVLALMFTVIGATWFLSARMAETRSDVDTISETVERLDKTVEGLSGTVENLGGTVDSLSTTVNSLSTTVDSLSTSMTELRTLNDTVQDLRKTVDGMGRVVGELDESMSVGFPLLLSCVIDLQGPWISGGVDERSYRQPGDSLVRLPTSCDMARSRMGRR